MLFLNEFDKKKLVGRFNLSHGEYESAIKRLNHALKMEQDPRIYFLAYA